MIDKNKNILDFWTLCEIADFERFKLDKDGIVPFKCENGLSKKIANEYYKEKISQLDYKKTTIYKIYIGIIKSEDAIKYIYKKLQSRNLIPKESITKSNRDIESLPSMPDYTYMAYIYVDENYNMISVANKSIVINPLFYILKNLLEKNLVNTIAYNEYIENFNVSFSEKFKIAHQSIACIILDIDFLLKNYNIGFLSKLKNCEIYVLEKLQKEISKIAKDKLHQHRDKAKNHYKFFEDEKSKENSIFRFPEAYEPNSKAGYYYLDVAIKMAEKKFYDFVYLLTIDKKYINIEIPNNLYLITYINEKNKLSPLLTYVEQKEESKICDKKLQMIFDDCCKELHLIDDDKTANIFYTQNNQTLSIFKQPFFNKTFQEIDAIEESKFLSYYINSLDEEPQKSTLKYLNGSVNKININESIEIRKSYNQYKYFQQIRSRWSVEHSLYYAQQMAVNHFFNNFNTSSNVFSVNGPPGTGKTTLLKDIIAEIIRRRVEKCIALDGDLFDGDNLKDELYGKYEIVVSSNNNAAVENITKELPLLENFDFDYIGYKKDDFLLSQFANSFYSFDDENSVSDESWNIISFPLGNSTNYAHFKKQFENFKREVRDSEILDKEFLEDRKNILIEKFNKCNEKLDKLDEIFIKLDNIDTIEKSLEKIEVEIEVSKKDLNGIEKQISNLLNDIENENNSKLKEEEYIKNIREVISLKKDILDSFHIIKKIFQWRAYRKVKIEIIENKMTLSNHLENLQNFEKFLENKKNNLSKLKNDKRICENKYESYKNNYESLKEEFRKLEELKDTNINNNHFYKQEEKIIQKSSLYNEESYLKYKAECFALSIQLNEVFFLINFDKFSNSMESYLNDFKKVLSLEDKKILQKNFSAMFFLVPVVSTSLASSYTMFKNISSFGTLLCDESGQATPQSLVGLLNRASNTLIVGDPLQVEPVFTAPQILIDLMQSMYEIEDIYSPVKSSAQRLADEANSLGSYYGEGDNKLWVGMPLVVHRRCVDPMFSISNKISYDDKMVLATPAIKKGDIINKLPPSAWINVKSQESDFNNTNISEKEMEALERFISKYSDILQNNYYVISPFKNIYSYSNKYEDKSLGTVHTFQGKEQDVVFFILGGNVARVGAKGWVSSKPNILNVAVTRAKKRVYFIGDLELWKGHKYFSEAICLVDEITI